MTVVDVESTVGGGSLPGQLLPSRAFALTVPSPQKTAARLRQPAAGHIPVVARIEEDRLLFDARTVLPEQDGALLDTLRWVLANPDVGAGGD